MQSHPSLTENVPHLHHHRRFGRRNNRDRPHADLLLSKMLQMQSASSQNPCQTQPLLRTPLPPPSEGGQLLKLLKKMGPLLRQSRSGFGVYFTKTLPLQIPTWLLLMNGSATNLFGGFLTCPSTSPTIPSFDSFIGSLTSCTDCRYRVPSLYYICFIYSN